jgi:hypothetical protein
MILLTAVYLLQYVDLDYKGNGLSEYMIYDAHSGSWDKSACKAANSDRCVKMDCHSKVRTLNNTLLSNWSSFTGLFV